ncbi:MAG: hypothetical protein KF773_06330 [Deltaproteobacteria bacterium]|nr:hypothetical protein [Deltaproteobacteria bacterium]
MRAVVFAYVLAATAAACGPAAVAPVAGAVREPARAALEELRAFAVTDDDFYRPVLYTWTTAEGAAALRASKQLLVATASSGTFVSPFNRALAASAASAAPHARIARVVAEHPALIRRRYAWPAPFATVRGIGPVTYGSALVRIELLPEAWIGRFEPGAPHPWRFVDASGAAVPEETVLASPERIAAIFHVRTEDGQPVRFREFVVCSEKALRGWAIATPDIRAELDREARLLLALRGAIADDARPAWRAWGRTPGAAATALELWNAALAFDNLRYRPTPHRIDQILDALATYDPTGAPLDHRGVLL